MNAFLYSLQSSCDALKFELRGDGIWRQQFRQHWKKGFLNDNSCFLCLYSLTVSLPTRILPSSFWMHWRLVLHNRPLRLDHLICKEGEKRREVQHWYFLFFVSNFWSLPDEFSNYLSAGWVRHWFFLFFVSNFWSLSDEFSNCLSSYHYGVRNDRSTSFGYRYRDLEARKTSHETSLGLDRSFDHH